MVKEKAIYANLNMLRLQSTYYEGYLWAPQEEEANLMTALQELTKQQANIVSGQIMPMARIPAGRSPPTLIKTNEVTWPMQEIVNTYGIPRYGEINPGLFTVVTFPFLFGVMFGDIIHGFLILLAGK